MPEIPPQTFSRRVCLKDFLDDDDTNNKDVKNKYNKNYSQNDTNTIEKNQIKKYLLNNIK